MKDIQQIIVVLLASMRCVDLIDKEQLLQVYKAINKAISEALAQQDRTISNECIVLALGTVMLQFADSFREAVAAKLASQSQAVN